MKILIIISIFFLNLTIAYSQETLDYFIDSSNAFINHGIETMPIFNDSIDQGFDTFKTQIMVKTMKAAYKDSIDICGKVYVVFIVDKDGMIKEPQIIKTEDNRINKYLISSLLNSPKWIPGKQNGIPVRVKYNLYLSFKCIE